MSHFYGLVSGNRGEATRMGSKDSGFVAWAQSHYARVTVRLWHSSQDEKDSATIAFGAGHSTHYGSRGISIDDISALVEALDTNDEKIERIWRRINDEFERLNEEAPKAIVRTNKKREKERKKQEREERRIAKERAEIRRDMQPEEKARVVRLLRDVELDAEGNFTSGSIYELARADLRLNSQGHTYINVPAGWGHHVFDVTAGQWVLEFDPDDIGFDEEKRQGFGYRLCRQESIS